MQVVEWKCCRCAQPLVGVSKRCREDEQHLQNIMDTNLTCNRLTIYDARPKVLPYKQKHTSDMQGQFC